MKKDIKKFKLGGQAYKLKANANEFVGAVERVQAFLQTEANKVYGKNAPTISYAYTTKWIYENYLKGKSFP